MDGLVPSTRWEPYGRDDSDALSGHDSALEVGPMPECHEHGCGQGDLAMDGSVPSKRWKPHGRDSDAKSGRGDSDATSGHDSALDVGPTPEGHEP